MIKGLRPGPMAQYFARKPPQTLEKLLQKMDEYIRADNDFRQRREEAYRFSEMTRGFGGRIHPRHVRSCTLLRATLPTYQNMWAIILQLLLLRLAIHRLPGHSSHPHHHYNQPIPEASS
jgi:hypothetical protein